MTQSWKIKKQKFFLFASRQINDIRVTDPDTENTDHGKKDPGYEDGSGYGFLRTACQPIRIENFEKPYNNTWYLKRIPGPSTTDIPNIQLQ
jgi:hypothetical protein